MNYELSDNPQFSIQTPKSRAKHAPFVFSVSFVVKTLFILIIQNPSSKIQKYVLTTEPVIPTFHNSSFIIHPSLLTTEPVIPTFHNS